MKQSFFILGIESCSEEEAKIISALEIIIFGHNHEKIIKKLTTETESSICGVEFINAEKVYSCESYRRLDDYSPSRSHGTPLLCVKCYTNLSDRSYQYRLIEYG